MDYITIVAPTYEDAVAQARKEYGSRLRIHSRKDITKSGVFGLGKTTECELTCFLTEEEKPVESKEVDLAVSVEVPSNVENEEEKDIERFEKEAKTPDPDAAYKDNPNVASLAYFEQAKKNIEEQEKTKEEQVVKEEPAKEEEKEAEEVKPAEDSSTVVSLLQRVEKILAANDFTSRYIEWLTGELRDILNEALPKVPTDEELEILVLDKIAESLSIDTSFSQNPERVVAVLGPASSGKTTMVAKLVATFSSISSSVRRNVRVVLLDDSPAVVGQFQKLGKALNVGVTVAPHEQEMTDALNAQFNNELVFVDAVGRPIQNNNPDYRIYGLMNVANNNETKYLMTIPASMKNSDIARVFEQYKSYPVSGLLVTKLDETSTVGNIISLSFEHDLPILYTSSGKKIPKDISKASSNAFLRLLCGFSIDVNKVIDSEL